LTLQQLAERSGLSIGGISKIETGEVRNPHLLTRRALAQALGYWASDTWPVSRGRPHPDLKTKRG
jgi:transcriptional regulator with XRE-family HTH domain